MNKKVFFIGLLLMIAVAYNVAVAYVDNQLKKKDFSGLYNNCHKIWAARGLYNERSEQNTPKAMNRAFSLGAKGAEVDVHYDLNLKRFIVSHDHPKKDENGKLVYSKKGGKILYMEDFFKAVEQGHYYWLDFKNLGKLTDEQTDFVISQLEEITQYDGLKERLYIEGSNPLLLSKYTDAGFKTILGIHPLPESNILSSLAVNIYKLGFYFNNISVIAMPYGKLEDPTFGKSTIKSLSSIPTFIFHVPDNDKLVRKLVSTKSVNVVMVGKDLSINRYDIHACN